MSDSKKMLLNERFDLIRSQQAVYRVSSRAEKREILNRLAQLTGLHRKSLIRKLNGVCERCPRAPVYGAEIDAALRRIAEA